MNELSMSTQILQHDNITYSTYDSYCTVSSDNYYPKTKGSHCLHLFNFFSPKNMSTSKGSNLRKRPQKHQNRTAFKNDLHDKSHKTKFINSLQITGVCQRCKDILEWKIKYKKYKPLTAPSKCVGCEQKTVKYAYHMICTKCALDKKTCAKCCKPVEGQDSPGVEEPQNTDLKAMLKDLPERKRRTIMRIINKQEEGQQKLTPEIKAQVDDMLMKMDNIDLDDDFKFTDDEDDAECQSENENESA